MGWFSKHIMGGDTPMDSESMILSILKVKKTNGHSKWDEKKYLERLKIALNEKQQMLYDELKKRDANIYDLQVLGVMILNSGANFLPIVRDLVLKCLEKDEWAQSTLERKIYVNEMIEIIKGYDKLAFPEPTLEYKVYPEIEEKEWNHPQYSSKVAKVAMSHFREYVKDYPIIQTVQLGMDGRDGYNITCLIDDSDEEKVRDFILKNDKFEWSGLMEVPLRLIFTSDFVSV